MTLLSRVELDSVKLLSTITSAVYIMRSLGTASLYRVGAIGVKGDNNAMRRLAQCFPGDPSGAGWHYVALRVIHGNMNVRRRREQSLRAATILRGGAFAGTREGRSDRFICHDEAKLLQLFRRHSGD